MIRCHSLAGLSVQMDEHEASMEAITGSSAPCHPLDAESQGYKNILTLLVF